MAEAVLKRHRAVWQHKPVLRRLYSEWYGEIVQWLAAGQSVEVGGGTGNLKDSVPQIYCTDVVPVPWLDAVADAHRLPFRSGTLSNLILFDALHHLEQPALFFDEAVRTLRPGGRLIIMDPYVSWASWPVYRFLHPEPLDCDSDPWIATVAGPGRKPFDSNQAVSTIIFESGLRDFQVRYPELTVRHRLRTAFFAYPLSGGFDHPSLLPTWAVTPLLRLERALGGLGAMLAFRILVVLERRT